MTNEIIKPEQAVDLFGAPARAFGVVANTETGRILNQTVKAVRQYEEDGRRYRITAALRFDDSCGNGHESFAITGYIDEANGKTWREHSCGCLHEEIARHFPELAHLVRWHLTSTDGPMHYLANTLYMAGDRDYNGREAGEPSVWSHGVRFGNSPITHKIEKRFSEWLARHPGLEVAIVAVPYSGTSDYKFGPKYTLRGFDCAWHACPFDSETEAAEFAEAFNTLPVELVTIPTEFSEGKARDLEAARRAACWPEATDEELSAPRAVLEAALIARLPALLAAFKTDMTAAGLLWPAVETAGA
jgi:hypothetical protein